MSISLYAAADVLIRSSFTLADILAAKRVGITEEQLVEFNKERIALKKVHDQMDLMSPEARAEFESRLNDQADS